MLTSMADEGLDVWDDAFIAKVIQAEEQALSATQHYHHAPPFHPPPPPHGNHHISYSPPRELSQRVQDAPTLPAISVNRHSCVTFDNDDEEEEIGRLKRELARVSKKLTLLEEECLVIKQERDKKEEQLKNLSSTTEAKDEELCHKNSKTLHLGVDIHNCGSPQEYQKEDSLRELLESKAKISTKGVGIQTDKVGESDDSSRKDDSSVAHFHQSKLLHIWKSFNNQTFGRDLVLKLFSVCEVDFQVLFGYLNLSFPAKSKIDTSLRSHVSLMGLPQPADAAKVSRLYFMLTKLSNDMARFEDLLEALKDLCGLSNVMSVSNPSVSVVFLEQPLCAFIAKDKKKVKLSLQLIDYLGPFVVGGNVETESIEAIVYRSLRVLSAVLKHVFSTKRTFSTRDNIIVVGPLAENTLSDKCEDRSCDNESPNAHSKRKLEQSDLQQEGNLSNTGMNSFTRGPAFSVSDIDWFSLFEMMCKITSTNLEEYIRLEAVYIMNIIVRSCNAYSEREKFASALVFRSILQLLRREAGFPVRKQAVKLLYQLLNCPKVTAVFCSGYQGGEDAVIAEIDTKMNSTIQEISLIMEALVDCIAFSENSANELKLRRAAITLVAFLASLGKTGFAIMLNCRLPDRNNILACILQSLVSDVDSDALDSAPLFDLFRERTLLLREALILLNRLVSHPQYSVPVLQALTSSRDMACLTIDIAKRLSQKRKCLWQDDTVTKQIRESEITELARVFKRRVFAFVGDSIS